MKDPHKRFLFRLARDLNMTVSRLGRVMTSEEFGEWAAYYTWEAKENKRQQEIAETRARIRRR